SWPDPGPPGRDADAASRDGAGIDVVRAVRLERRGEAGGGGRKGLSDAGSRLRDDRRRGPEGRLEGGSRLPDDVVRRRPDGAARVVRAGVARVRRRGEDGKGQEVPEGAGRDVRPSRADSGGT